MCVGRCRRIGSRCRRRQARWAFAPPRRFKFPGQSANPVNDVIAAAGNGSAGAQCRPLVGPDRPALFRCDAGASETFADRKPIDGRGRPEQRRSAGAAPAGAIVQDGQEVGRLKLPAGRSADAAAGEIRPVCGVDPFRGREHGQFRAAHRHTRAGYNLRKGIRKYRVGIRSCRRVTRRSVRLMRRRRRPRPRAWPGRNGRCRPAGPPSRSPTASAWPPFMPQRCRGN